MNQKLISQRFFPGLLDFINQILSLIWVKLYTAPKELFALITIRMIENKYENHLAALNKNISLQFITLIKELKEMFMQFSISILIMKLRMNILLTIPQILDNLNSLRWQNFTLAIY